MATILEFDEWLQKLEAAFMQYGGYTADQAHNYVFDNRPEWREYYDDDYSPIMAANLDMSYGAD